MKLKAQMCKQLGTKIGYYTGLVAKEGPVPAPAAKEGSAAPGSLRGLIDVNGGRLLNAGIISSIKNIASPPPAGYAISSAVGSRVLIYLPFTQAVSPSYLKITVDKAAQQKRTPREYK